MIAENAIVRAPASAAIAGRSVSLVIGPRYPRNNRAAARGECAATQSGFRSGAAAGVQLPSRLAGALTRLLRTSKARSASRPQRLHKWGTRRSGAETPGSSAKLPRHGKAATGEDAAADRHARRYPAARDAHRRAAPERVEAPRGRARAILGARAAERYDAKAARRYFNEALAGAHPQERPALRQMMKASLALAERRPDDLKEAVAKLGQEPPPRASS